MGKVAERDLAMVRSALEAARLECEKYAQRKWREYKTGHGEGRANPHWQGQSDGAEDCSDAILAIDPAQVVAKAKGA